VGCNKHFQILLNRIYIKNYIEIDVFVFELAILFSIKTNQPKASQPTQKKKIFSFDIELRVGVSSGFFTFFT